MRYFFFSALLCAVTIGACSGDTLGGDSPMAESAPCEPEGPGVNILEFCFQADPVSEGIVLLLFPIYGFFLVALTGKKWRALIRSWLYGATWSRAYAGLLDDLLARLDHFFGPPRGWRAFELCFALAMLYTIAYLLLHYALRQAVPSLAIPIVATAGAGGVVLVFLFRRVKQRYSRTRQGAARRERLWLHLMEQATYCVLGLWTYFAATAAAIVVGVLTTGAIDISLAAVVAAVVVVVVGAGAGAGTGTLVSAATVAAVHILRIRSIDASELNTAAVEFAVTISILIFGIPLLNALFDWPSWWASRWLMTRLREDALREGVFRRLGAVLAHVAADFTLALACLFGLSIVIANVAFGVGFPEVWADYYVAAKTAPFSGYGSAMTVMLISTLVPTAMHLFFAVFALAVLRPPFATHTAFWLKEDKFGDEKGTQMLVALYLTVCAGFALMVLWGAGRLAIMGLNGLVGGADIWHLIFETADRFVIF